MPEYPYKIDEQLHHHGYLLSVLPKVLPKSEGLQVADLGCGDGSLTARYSRPSWKVTGFDSSASGIRIASERFPQHNWQLVDFSTCPRWEGEQFDLVVSCEVIEHIYDPYDFVGRCRDMLRPGGVLMLSTPYHGYLKNLMLAVSGALDRHFTALWPGGHIKFWSRNTLTRLLADSGFTDIRFFGAGRFPFLWKSMIILGTRA